MAYSFAGVTDDEFNLWVADKPLLVGSNALKGNVTSAEWRTATGGGGSDNTDASFPTARAYDLFGHVPTKAATTGTRFFHIVLSSPIEFDSWAYIGHNLGLTGVSIAIADDAAMTTNKITIGSFGALFQFKRGATYNLNHAGSGLTRPVRYSNVQFIELAVSVTGPAVCTTSEIWLGKRHQLRFKPNEAWDERRVVAEFNDFESGSGVTRRYQRYAGQRRTQPKFTVDRISDMSEFRTFWNETGFGQQNFLYSESPLQAPDRTYLMYSRNGVFTAPRNGGPELRVISWDFREQPPFVTSEIGT